MAKYKTEIHYIFNNKERIKINALIRQINVLNYKIERDKILKNEWQIRRMIDTVRDIQEMLEYLGVENQLENNKQKIK